MKNPHPIPPLRIPTSSELYAFRYRYQITMQELAEELGVNVTTVWRWETQSVPKRGLAVKSLARYMQQIGREASRASAIG
jgi:DNA-binding transcriptional regulator YiaG